LHEVLDSLGASIELNRPEKVDLDTPQVAPEANKLKPPSDTDLGPDGLDTLFLVAVEWVVETNKVSISSVQRRLRIGYNRAWRIVVQLEEQGYVSEPSETGGRSVLAKADNATA
jgi:DNA segregation ATPase FtsK/SpoIIIE-like protein